MTSTFREPIKVVADILAHELPLDSAHIMLNDEKWNIPKDNTIFMVLTYLGPDKTIASSNHTDFSVNPPLEIQQTNKLLNIQVDLMSYGSDARARKEEVEMALASQYSKRWQEKYQLQIAKQPAPLMDVSNLEGTSMLKRFTTTISVTALFTKTKPAEYYETFPTPEVYPNE